MEQVYNTTEIYTSINEYIYPMLSKKDVYKKDKLLELIDFTKYILKPINGYTHFVIPLLKKYYNQLDLNQLVENLEKDEIFILKAFLYLAFGNEYLQKFVKSSHLITAYNKELVLNNNLLSNEKYLQLCNDIKKINLAFNVDLYITSRDLKIETNNEKIDYSTIERKVYFYIEKLLTILNINDIMYAVGGGMGIYLTTGIETSLDVDVIIQKSDKDKLHSCISQICMELDAHTVVYQDNFISIKINKIPITLDFEIGQHYRQKIDLSKDNTTFIQIRKQKNFNVRVVLLEEILKYKIHYGRLKDVNNIYNIYREINKEGGRNRTHD